MEVDLINWNLSRSRTLFSGNMATSESLFALVQRRLKGDLMEVHKVMKCVEVSTITGHRLKNNGQGVWRGFEEECFHPKGG